MTSIHPSEDPPLGWLVPCLAVADLRASLDFYARLDLMTYGGDVDENWAMLRNRAVEIHLFQGHIPRDLLNFRGGDADRIRTTLDARGLVMDNELGETSFIYRDPDRREVFFDTSPAECRAYEAGQLLTDAVPEGDIHAGSGLDLGNLTWGLACGDVAATMAFYRTLGLVRSEGDPAGGGVLLARADHLPAPGRRLVTTTLTLFDERLPADRLAFRGGDVGAIAAGLGDRDGVRTGSEGGESLIVRDPDGRTLSFEATPPERL